MLLFSYYIIIIIIITLFYYYSFILFFFSFILYCCNIIIILYKPASFVRKTDYSNMKRVERARQPSSRWYLYKNTGGCAILKSLKTTL